jgi:hypothetical protein
LHVPPLSENPSCLEIAGVAGSKGKTPATFALIKAIAIDRHDAYQSAGPSLGENSLVAVWRSAPNGYFH